MNEEGFHRGRGYKLVSRVPFDQLSDCLLVAFAGVAV